jgi:hypothetical protein
MTFKDVLEIANIAIDLSDKDQNNVKPLINCDTIERGLYDMVNTKCHVMAKMFELIIEDNGLRVF